MFTLASPFSSPNRPVITGQRGTISAENPLAVAAGLRAYDLGGGAVDAMIAAQAVLCVVSPEACGLGGDMLALVHAPDAGVLAWNGAGAAPAALPATHAATQPATHPAAPAGAQAITVPGLVGAWCAAHARHGRVALADLLAPAIRLARGGFRISPYLAQALVAQRARLIAIGAGAYPLLGRAAGDVVRLPALAHLLEGIGRDGAAAFYGGEMAQAIARAVARQGGSLNAADLAAHRTTPDTPNRTGWAGLTLLTQPPMTQGILLNMALAALERSAPADPLAMDHAGIELTEAAFAHRDRAGQGTALMAEPLTHDPARALHRGGPRAYLHTAAVACADDRGVVVSSLVSVFDDFGSGVFVPEGGFTLNNRAAGFGAAPNDAAPAKRPVHTLAPALLTDADGTVWAMATPGADGQVQTLLQVLAKARLGGVDLATAVAAPRWRSENGALLVETGHPHATALAALGHRVQPLPAGDLRFGAVAAAGFVAGAPCALADWRRLTTSAAT